MRIKNLMGVSEVRLKKKLDSFTLEMSKNHLIRNFLRNGRLRVKMGFLALRHPMRHFWHIGHYNGFNLGKYQLHAIY